MSSGSRSSRKSVAERFAGYTDRQLLVYAALFGLAVLVPLALISLRSSTTLAEVAAYLALGILTGVIFHRLMTWRRNVELRELQRYDKRDR